MENMPRTWFKGAVPFALAITISAMLTCPSAVWCEGLNADLFTRTTSWAVVLRGAPACFDHCRRIWELRAGITREWCCCCLRGNCSRWKQGRSRQKEAGACICRLYLTSQYF